MSLYELITNPLRLNSLSKKILLSIIGTSLICMIILSFFTYQNISKQLEDQQETLTQTINQYDNSDNTNKINNQIELSSAAIRDSLFKKLLWVSGICLLLTIGFGLIIASRITNPIKTFSKTITEISQGDLSTQVHAAPDTEIQLLRDAVQIIIDILRNTIHEAKNIASELSKGVTTVQVDETKFEGNFKNIFIELNKGLKALLVFNKTTQILQNIASGNLNTELDGEFEGDFIQLQQSVNSMIQEIRGMIQKMINLSSGLSVVMTSLTELSSTILTSNQKQSSMVASSASAITELSASIAEIATSTKTSQETSEKSSEIAKNSAEIIEKMISGMEQIYTLISQSSKKMGELSGSNKEIRNIIKVITDIADQTDLLALNAAIEAARAGDQGRGFAVVADEIRQLAERSKKSAEEIIELIEKINGQSDDVLSSMKNVEDQSKYGTDLSRSAGKALDDIINHANNANQIMTQVAEAVNQQSYVSNDLAKSMDDVGDVSNNALGVSSDLSECAKELMNLTENLNTISNKFTL